MAGFVFSGIGASNSTIWSLVHFSIRIVSFICTLGALWAGWKIVRSNKVAAGHKQWLLELPIAHIIL
jgi:hypothetical protein